MLLLVHLPSCGCLRDGLLLLMLSNLLRRVLLLHLLLAQQLRILLRARGICDAVRLGLLLRRTTSGCIHCVLGGTVLSLLHSRPR